MKKKGENFIHGICCQRKYNIELMPKWYALVLNVFFLRIQHCCMNTLFPKCYWNYNLTRKLKILLTLSFTSFNRFTSIFCNFFIYISCIFPYTPGLGRSKRWWEKLFLKKKKKKGFNIHFSGLLFVKKQKKGHKPNFFSFAGHL